LIENPASLIPPPSTLVDVLPSTLLFGVGISLVVAPLTSTLMSSVPVHNAGLASAINNAISRVGQPILAAVIFIVVSGAFYSALAAHGSGVDPSSPEIRREFQPLNPPASSAPPQLAAAAREASTDAFHLAAIVGALLLVTGAAVNYVGLREGTSTAERAGTTNAAAGWAAPEGAAGD